MKRLVEWAAHNALLSILLAAIIVAARAWAATELGIDALPDVTNIQVQVATCAPALSAQEVEMQVTLPVERAMAGIAGLTLTRGITKLGASVVTLIVRDDTHIDLPFALAGGLLALVLRGLPFSIPAGIGAIARGTGAVVQRPLATSSSRHSSWP